MTPEQIEEMKADMAAGTQGPWWYQERSDAYTHIVRSGESRFLVQLGQDTSGVAESNARRIARLPELEAEVLRLLEENEALSEGLTVAYLKDVYDERERKALEGLTDG